MWLVIENQHDRTTDKVNLFRSLAVISTCLYDQKSKQNTIYTITPQGISQYDLEIFIKAKMSASEGNICLPLNSRLRGLEWEDCEFTASLGYRVSACLKGYKGKHFKSSCETMF